MATVPVNDNQPLDLYTAYAGQAQTAWTFWVEDAQDLELYINGTLKAYGSDFTIDLSRLKNDNGGPIYLVNPLAGGEKIAVSRSTKIDRVTGFSEGGGGSLRGSILNLELSRLVCMLQDKQRDINRSLRLSNFSGYAGSLILPESSPNKGLKWASDGLSITNGVFDIDEIGNQAQASADAADASATAASGSASAAAGSASAANGSAVAAAASAVLSQAAAASLRGVTNVTEDITLNSTHRNNLLLVLGPGNCTVSLPTPASLGAGFEFQVRNETNNDNNSIETANAASDIQLNPLFTLPDFGLGRSITYTFVSNGSKWIVTSQQSVDLIGLDFNSVLFADGGAGLFVANGTSAVKQVLGTGLYGGSLKYSDPFTALTSAGQLLTGGFTGDQILAAGRTGQALRANANATLKLDYGEAVDPRYKVVFLDDFTDYFGRCYTGTTGTGASAGGGTNAGTPGLIALSTGTTAAGGAIVGQCVNNRAINTSRQIVFETSIFLGALSSGAQEYVAFFGFNDKGTTISSAHPSNGVYFYYDRATNGDKFAVRTVNGGVNTNTVYNALTLLANTIYRLRIEITNGTVTFYINSTLVATHTTNIPVNANVVGFSNWIQKTVGTTAVILYSDYIMMTEEVNR
jgi:hypothetical protein